MSEKYIRNVKDARSCIGETVWWDEDAKRAWVLRCGIVTDVIGRNIEIDHDWKWRADLKNLRNFKEGGFFRVKTK